MSNRTESKRLAARIFDAAIRACGYTNERVGGQVDLDERRVRRLRSDDIGDLDVVPTLAHLIDADHALGEKMLAEIRTARLALHGTPPAVTIERRLAASMRSASELLGEGATVLEDGAVSNPERARIDERAAALETQLGLLRAELRKESMR